MSTLILDYFKERYPLLSKFFQLNLFLLDVLGIVASISVLSITPLDNDCSGSFRPLVTIFLISNSLSAIESLSMPFRHDMGIEYAFGNFGIYSNIIFVIIVLYLNILLLNNIKLLLKKQQQHIHT